MNRSLLLGSIFTILLVLAAPATARAQINVVKKPAPDVGPDEYVVYDSWSCSWGLRDDPPDKYPLGIAVYKTEAEARSAAKAHMARTAGNGAYAVTHYLIEGEASLRSKKGPSLPSADQLERDAINALTKGKLGGDNKTRTELFYDAFKTVNALLTDAAKDALEKARRTVKDAYNTAKEGKEFVVRNVDKITEDDFNKANALIAKYNSSVEKYSREGPGSEYFSRLPRMTPVNPGDLKRQFEKWKEAANKQVALQKQKEDLDRQRAQLDQERQDLIKDGIDDYTEGDAINTARKSLERGPYEPRIFGDVIIPGRFNFGITNRKFSTWQEAADYLKQDGYLPGQRATITDRNGKRMDSPPSDSGEQAQSLRNRENGLRSRTAGRQDRVNQYKTDLDAYNRTLQEYEQNLRSYRSSLGNDAYQPPSISTHAR
jgi:hypothetical protein